REEAAALAREIEALAAIATQNAKTASDVNAIVEQQTDAMNAVADSSQHLASIAERLKESMSRFNL
ncbi:MAG TPA: hypothetical protein VG818_14270, partial [Gemmatimonadaceae bacterium]|nr:hypothetical protein [Gemmatimonadaceae bacterium]